MRIGELAARSGVSARSLRYYEQQQLLVPHRTSAGQRVYDDDAIDAVQRIRELFGAGFCSAGIRELLPLLAAPATEGVRLAEEFGAARRRLESERAAVEEELVRLGRLADRYGVALDMRVRGDACGHEYPDPAEAVAPDHRDRRLR